MAVDHRPLGGNHRKVTCDLLVEGVERDTVEREEVSFPFRAYDAPIDVNVLVSYEWLGRNNVHVHPRPDSEKAGVEPLGGGAPEGSKGARSLGTGSRSD